METQVDTRPFLNYQNDKVVSVLFQSTIGDKQGGSSYFLNRDGTYNEVHSFGDLGGVTTSSRERIEELDRHVGGASIIKLLGSSRKDAEDYLKTLEQPNLPLRASCCGEGDCHHCCR